MTSPVRAPTTDSSAARTALFLVVAIVAFAANSLLCRAALGPGHIDAASFTVIRLVSGAVVLALLVRARDARPGGGSWRGGLALCVYAVAFSTAYLRLSTGTGALILFGAVQVTMIASASARGERLHARQWIGLSISLGGLAWLVLPGQRAPDPLGALLMATAGAAWGVYSLLGRGATRPLAATAHNFLWSLPLAALFVVIERDALHGSTRGVVLAVISGAAASGLGYAVWYAALRTVKAARAAIVQLCVPVLSALGGVAVLDEDPSAHLLVCTVLVLAGVALAVVPRPSE